MDARSFNGQLFTVKISFKIKFVTECYIYMDTSKFKTNIYVPTSNLPGAEEVYQLKGFSAEPSNEGCKFDLFDMIPFKPGILAT